jgi:DNA-binding transcriptional regulator YdaS (Cro superfamily)
MARPILNPAVVRAADIAGGQSALARIVGVKQGHVWDWIYSTGLPPPVHCPAIEIATGVTCEELRADLLWERDDDRRVTAYRVPLSAPGEMPMRKAAAGA